MVLCDGRQWTRPRRVDIGASVRVSKAQIVTEEDIVRRSVSDEAKARHSLHPRALARGVQNRCYYFLSGRFSASSSLADNDDVATSDPEVPRHPCSLVLGVQNSSEAFDALSNQRHLLE